MFRNELLKTCMMKNVLFMFAAVLSVLTAAAGDRRIAFADLPQPARIFVERHFDRTRVISVYEDEGRRKEYEVELSDGSEIEFDASGNWTKVKAGGREVPRGVLPAAVIRYTAAEYPELSVVQIERHGCGYEVELSDDRELLFDASGRVVKIDD